jgi:hypothetical protein
MEVRTREVHAGEVRARELAELRKLKNRQKAFLPPSSAIAPMSPVMPSSLWPMAAVPAH